MAKLIVHRWRKYDISTDEMQVSQRMATEEAIERHCGEMLKGTAREIDETELDPTLDGMTPRGFHFKSADAGFQRQVR